MIYFIQSGQDGAIKIGYTNGDPSSRLKALQTATPSELRLLHYIPGTLNFEASLHAKFNNESLGREWFRPSKELMDYIESQKLAGDLLSKTPLRVAEGLAFIPLPENIDLEKITLSYCYSALEQTGYNETKAANLLGLTRAKFRVLHRRLNRAMSRTSR